MLSAVTSNGLKQIITHNNKKGYVIYTYKCLKCDEEISSKVKKKNCKCGGELHLIDTMGKEKVQDIVSRQSEYVCIKCGKSNNFPFDCCVAHEKHIQRIVSEYGAPLRMIEGL